MERGRRNQCRENLYRGSERFRTFTSANGVFTYTNLKGVTCHPFQPARSAAASAY